MQVQGNKIPGATYLDISFPLLVFVVCILPTGGLLFCEIWSLIYAYESSTKTYCLYARNVKNFFPSVSVAIGTHTPQKYIWRITIAMHTAPRLLMTLAYYNLYSRLFEWKNFINKFFRLLSMLSQLLHLTEILTLIGLSFVSSKENYALHRNCFMTFLFCGTLNMILVCILHKWGWRVANYRLNVKERRSLRLKAGMLVCNVCSILAAAYFFYRHNNYCENNVYSFFGISELGVILSNVGFHATAMLDFRGTRLLLWDFGVGADASSSARGGQVGVCSWLKHMFTTSQLYDGPSQSLNYII